jgi:hypothetical protein
MFSQNSSPSVFIFTPKAIKFYNISGIHHRMFLTFSQNLPTDGIFAFQIAYPIIDNANLILIP